MGLLVGRSPLLARPRPFAKGEQTKDDGRQTIQTRTARGARGPARPTLDRAGAVCCFDAYIFGPGAGHGVVAGGVGLGVGAGVAPRRVGGATAPAVAAMARARTKYLLCVMVSPRARRRAGPQCQKQGPTLGELSVRATRRLLSKPIFRRCSIRKLSTCHLQARKPCEDRGLYVGSQARIVR